MNCAELRGLRASAEALNPKIGERFAIVEGDRIRAFDLSEETAEDWRETFFPMADVVRMTEIFKDEFDPAAHATPEEIKANEAGEPGEDESDMVCPECGEPDCLRPFGHLTEDDERSIVEDIAYHEAKDEGRLGKPR